MLFQPDIQMLVTNELTIPMTRLAHTEIEPSENALYTAARAAIPVNATPTAYKMTITMLATLRTREPYPIFSGQWMSFNVIASGNDFCTTWVRLKWNRASRSEQNVVFFASSSRSSLSSKNPLQKFITWTAQKSGRFRAAENLPAVSLIRSLTPPCASLSRSPKNPPSPSVVLSRVPLPNWEMFSYRASVGADLVLHRKQHILSKALRFGEMIWCSQRKDKGGTRSRRQVEGRERRPSKASLWAVKQ